MLLFKGFFYNSRKIVYWNVFSEFIKIMSDNEKCVNKIVTRLSDIHNMPLHNMFYQNIMHKKFGTVAKRKL